MPSRSVCAFLYCDNSAANSPHLSFHRFPQNENSTDWIIRSGNDSLYDLTLKQLWDKRVCSEHFDKSAYSHNKRLRRNALPRMWTLQDAENHSKKTNKNNKIFDPANLPLQSTIVQESSKSNNELILPTLCENKEMLDDSVDPNSIEMLDEDFEEFESSNMSGVENIIHNQCESEKNLLKQKIEWLEKQLIDAEKMITTLKKMQNGRRVTVDSVLEDAAKFLNPNQLLLLRMQFKQLMMQKEWTSWEKNFACSLYNESSDAYKFLSEEQRIILPKATLVRRWIEMKSSVTANASQSTSLKKGDIVVISDVFIRNQGRNGN